MTREMQKMIKRNKENAALLVRYANPQSKSKLTDQEVLEILYRHIPYRGTVRPVITGFSVSRFNRNKIIKCAYFVVDLDNGESYQISAYQNLRGRTKEEKEADKTAEYPSRLFTIFHDKIKAPEDNSTNNKEEKTMLKTNSKKARENIRAYIVDNFTAENYTDTPPQDWPGIAVFILDTFRSEKPAIGAYAGMSEQERFTDWASGLPSVLDCCYYYNRPAIDDLADILEETAEEKARYTEAQAESLLTSLIYRELLKGCKQ